MRPNAKNVLLLPMSCHRPIVTSLSVYSLALRIRRICSKEEEAEDEFKKLGEKLRKREYGEQEIMEGIEKARRVTREGALKKVEDG